VLVAAAWLAGGCGLFEHLDVKNVATSVQKPANVAMLVHVKDGNKPLDELADSNFKLFENNQPIDPTASGQTLLDPTLAVVHHALLLVDMSGPASEAAVRSAIAHAAAGFVDRARRDQAVTVYAFDGSSQIYLIGEYPELKSGGPDLEDIPELESFTPHDTSRNLNGAIVAALRELDARLMQTKKPIRRGTLVVFTRGPDLAGRVSPAALSRAFDKTQDELFAVGVGKDTSDFRLEDIGRDGIERAPAVDAVGVTLERAADAVSATVHADYLLAYCSPARAGKRWLRVEVTIIGKNGDKRSGSVETQFDSSGFGPGCDPHTAPEFVVAGSAPVEPTPETNDTPSARPERPAPRPRDTEPVKREPKPGSTIVPPPSEPGYAPAPP
jgi:hypothetical protein